MTIATALHSYLTTASRTIDNLDLTQIHATVASLERLRDRNGRLFIIGNGGGAGHASHAAADFRKIARIESYAWGENISDATAYINDEGWECSISRWLDDSRCSRHDGLLVFSVGGATDTVSANLKWAMSYAKDGPTIYGVVGASGGEVARYANYCIVIPSFLTPHVEGTQAVVWHLLVEMLRANQ